jgi:predicted glycoside hydrolase/deacetylase ChbG (UPF0249 family)
MRKIFILNADDFGMSKTRNEAIFDGYKNGFLKSASICTNGDEFDDAVRNILPQCPELGIGVHLNIIEGKALVKRSSLTDKKGFFNKSFFQILQKSKDKIFLQDIENEFRAQIESGQKYINFDHLDSHVHTHAIPNLFKVADKLAREYKIPYIRTQYEKMYSVPDIRKHLNFKYPVNILKILLLNSFTKKNKKTISSLLKTNDLLIGVGFTGMMDEMTIEYGLRAAKEGVVEALIHPDTEGKTREYELTKNRMLEDKIAQIGFQLTNYRNLCRESNT